ncbi:MAG: PfkB family carbohydrate kinase [Mariprofundales bacterium]|nr:PfkB family carbohydrate kinase [Mariprofundales bacterium]
MRPLIFGEVLFDHFPDGTAVLGGAPFNVAWHLHAFGLKPLMISRIGDDELGRRVEAAMQAWGMDCAGMQKDSLHPTGSVQVSFNNGEPTYDIVDKVAYDFIDAAQMPQLDGDWLLYHGSLALRHADPAAALGKLKTKHARTRFVDINLRPPWWRQSEARDMIDGAAWVKLNGAELTELYPEASGCEPRLEMLAKQVTEQIVLTDGAQGARAIATATANRVSVVPESASSVVDTVGAGDSFCSVLVAGRLLGWPLKLSMQRAQAFASAVVGIRGATSQNKDFYHHFICDWEIKDHQHV